MATNRSTCPLFFSPFRRWCCALTAGLLLVVPAAVWAQAPTPVPEPTPAAPAAPAAAAPATAPAPVKDYSDGFRKIVQFGLPDAAKASYVNLQLYNGGGSDDWMSGLYQLRLGGNAWLLTENREAKSRFIVGQARTVEVFDFERQQKARMKQAEAAAAAGSDMVVEINPGSDAAGTWKAADVKQDMAKVLAFLAKAQEKKDARHEMYFQEESLGGLFLFVIHCWQQGFTAEANQMAAGLFVVGKDSRKVVLSALNILATAQYRTALDSFNATGDWQAFSTALAAVLGKYPAGWRQAPAVKLLAAKVAARAALTAAPPITGEGLTGEDQAIAAALFDIKPGPHGDYDYAAAYRGGGNLWLLKSATPPAAKLPNNAAPDVFGKLTARGIKSIPLLLALAKDDTLIARASERGMYGSRFGMDDGDSEAMALAMYSVLERPPTRGEIAMALLACVLPRADEDAGRGMFDDGEKDPDAHLQACRDFYTANKDKTRVELARHYLEKGGREQRTPAMQCLMENITDADAAALEAQLLKPGRSGLMENFSMAQVYVMRRGEKAKAFVDKLEAAVKARLAAVAGGKSVAPAAAAPSGGEDVEDVAVGEAGGSNWEATPDGAKELQRQLTAMRRLVEKREFSAVLADLAKGGETATLAEREIWNVAGREKPETVIAGVLTLAVNLDDPNRRIRLLNMLGGIRYMAAQMAQQQGDEAEAEALRREAQKRTLDIVPHAAQWKTLLADKRVLTRPGGEDADAVDTDMEEMQAEMEMQVQLQEMRGGGGAVADAAARTIDALYGKMGASEMLEARAGRMVPELMVNVLRARAEARVAGTSDKDLPPYPSADRVTPERRQAIVDQLIAAPLESVAGLAGAFAPDEQVFLAEALKDNEKLRKALAPLRLRLGKVIVAPTFPAAVVAPVQKLQGQPLTRAAVEQLLACCQTLASQGKGVRVAVATSSKLALGLVVTMTEIRPPPAKAAGARPALRSVGMPGHAGPSPRRSIVGTIYGMDYNANATWLVAPPADTAAKPAAVTAKTSAPAPGAAVTVPPVHTQVDVTVQGATVTKSVTVTQETTQGTSVVKTVTVTHGDATDGDDPILPDEEVGGVEDESFLREQQDEFWATVEQVVKGEAESESYFNLNFMAPPPPPAPAAAGAPAPAAPVPEIAPSPAVIRAE